MEPNKVTESLKQLLIELQKVKDLNNMANEYKTISANLVLALQNYLNDNREFSNTFNEYLNQTNKSVKDTNKTQHIGCLAQDLQKICPEIVHEGDDGFLSIEENKLVYLLLEEVKQLNKKVKELEAR